MGLGGNLEHRLCTSYPDYKKWDASFSPRSLESIAQESKKLVYLSADSENVIDTIDPEISYIVGGIVDRNRCKVLVLFSELLILGNHSKASRIFGYSYG